MGEYRGRCCICEEPQQLLDEEDEPILCSKCDSVENRKIFDRLCKENKSSTSRLDEVRWNNLMRFKRA